MSPALLILLIVMAPVAIVIPWLACVAASRWFQDRAYARHWADVERVLTGGDES